MITIDVLLKDGRTALADLEGSSPTGGFVTTERRPRTSLTPGDVVRDCGGWVVVVAVRHNGIHGVTSADLLDHAGIARGLLMYGSDGAEVRTDTQIDPDSLWRLVAGGRAAAASVVSEPAATAEPGRELHKCAAAISQA